MNTVAMSYSSGTEMARVCCWVYGALSYPAGKAMDAVASAAVELLLLYARPH